MAAERPGIGPGIDKSKSIEDLHHLRLMALLDELVRDRGARKAAADLDVDHRTLAASLESGRLTRRMRVALDRALLAGGGSPAREQQERATTSWRSGWSGSRAGWRSWARTQARAWPTWGTR